MFGLLQGCGHARTSMAKARGIRAAPGPNDPRTIDNRSKSGDHRVSVLYNFDIQPAMACPISSGESSWTKWSPATVTSVCAGNLRAKSRFAPPARSKPGSAFTNSLGRRLVASQSAYAAAISATSAGSPSMGICRTHVRVGRRPSPGSANRLRDAATSSAEEGAQDGIRQDLLDEKVVLQNHCLASLGTQRLQGWTHIRVVPMIPALRPHDRFHVGDTLHGLAMAVGPIETEGRAPVMDHEGDPLAHIQRLEQGIEVASVLDKVIRAGATVRQLVGVAHADQVGGDAAA